MELEALARRQPQGVVCVALRDVVEGEVLVRGESAAGDLGADHHDPFLAAALLSGGSAGVPVLLLIDAMELQELVLVLGEVIRPALERVLHGAAQMAAFFLGNLDF